MKTGQLVTPISMPELQGIVKRIAFDHWSGESIYILENGTAWTEDELDIPEPLTRYV